MRADARTLRRYISNTIQVVVQIQRLANGKRRVVSIAEIAGVEGDTYSLNELYRFTEDAASSEGGRFEAVAARSYFSARLTAIDIGEV
jgi:pilus assembly protein CpaF